MKYLISKCITVILIALLLNNKSANAQTNYQHVIDSAMSFYSAKQYDKAGTYFAKATRINGNKDLQSNIYNAACSWSLANQPDRAFKELDHILSGKNIIKGWDDPAEFHNMLIRDTDFDNLKKDRRWAQTVARSTERKMSFEASLDKKLVDELAMIRKDDQGLRLRLDTIRKNKGTNSIEEKELWRKINSSDSVSLSRILKLIDQKGWQSPAQVGYKGNQTIFLVIQHADIAVQQKYLPIMRAAVKKGKALPRDLALLEDRVAMRTGEKQIYGSQVGIDKATGIYYLYPVIDPDHLDDRRAVVGLESIASYLKNSFRLIWDVESYKKALPELVLKLKK